MTNSSNRRPKSGNKSIKPKDQVVYPLKSSCGVKENYQTGVVQSGCPYKNTSGVVNIESVG